MEREIRSCDIDFMTGESRTIDGYSIVFNSYSNDLGGFKEMVLPEALEGVLERSDVSLLLNHDNSRGILARCKNGKGSLKLDRDDKGLRFTTEAPNTSLGDEVLEYLRRGDAYQCSFAFTVAEGGDTWTKDANGFYIRTIHQFDKIFDCSILTCAPAYESTSVKCARFAEIQEEERLANEKALEEARLAEEQKKAEEERALEEYYTNLKKDNEAYLNLKEQMSDK